MTEEMVEIKYGKPGTVRSGYVSDPWTGKVYHWKLGVPFEVPRQLADHLMHKQGGPFKLSSAAAKKRTTKKEGDE